jgi:probable addiction module antidote protein
MVKISRYDTVDYLKTEEDVNEYLEIAFENGDPKLIARALGNAARARGMLATARKTKLDRAGLYRSLSKNGDPKLSTVSKVVHSLGYRLALAKA